MLPAGHVSDETAIMMNMFATTLMAAHRPLPKDYV